MGPSRLQVFADGAVGAAAEVIRLVGQRRVGGNSHCAFGGVIRDERPPTVALKEGI